MNRSIFRILILLGLSVLVSVVAPLGFAKPKAEDGAETNQKLQTFAEIFSAIRNNYVDEVDDEELIASALNGALEALDPHSHYVPLDNFIQGQKTAHREYGGLGIEVSMEDELVKVDYVLKHGPAGKAGVKNGDLISSVAGKPVRGKTLGEAVEGMRGLAGDSIDITVITPGLEPREVTVVREVVQGRVVRHRVEDGVAYIYIESFNHPRLADDVADAISELKKTMNGNIPGLIIDVRSNPGGAVEQTVEAAGHFLDGGEVFSSRGRTIEDTQRYNASAGELLEGVPIVVIVNSRSASAAEILAGALQDRGRGIVIGRRTFGKGSVQSVMVLGGKNGALRLTTQRYYTPSGKSIQGRGILPDVLVALRPDTGDTRKRFREDSLRNALTNPDDSDYEEDMAAIDYPPAGWPTTEDYQLQKAVEWVKSPRYKNMLASRN